MSDRDDIFQRIHQSLDKRQDRASYPDYEASVAVAESRLTADSLWEDFARNFTAVNGRPTTSFEDVIAFLKSEKVTRGYCDPSLKEPLGEACVSAGFDVEYAFEPDRYDDYQFGITRASGAIAETGTVVLTDTETSDRLGALTPWIHVAALDPTRLVRTIGDAIATFGTEPNIIWATGPSKTADVEGILIEGVHGPGEQFCLRL